MSSRCVAVGGWARLEQSLRAQETLRLIRRPALVQPISVKLTRAELVLARRCRPPWRCLNAVLVAPHTGTRVPHPEVCWRRALWPVLHSYAPSIVATRKQQHKVKRVEAPMRLVDVLQPALAIAHLCVTCSSMRAAAYMHHSR